MRCSKLENLVQWTLEVTHNLTKEHLKISDTMKQIEKFMLEKFLSVPFLAPKGNQLVSSIS